MTGWRVGWACGNRELIAGLAKVKSNIDSGIFSAIQICAATALDKGDSFIQDMSCLYQKRRDALVNGLNKIGWKAVKPKATFYVWARTPSRQSSIECASFLLDKADIVVTPGVGFGSSAEGYVRFALTVAEERIAIAIERLKKIL